MLDPCAKRAFVAGGRSGIGRAVAGLFAVARAVDRPPGDGIDWLVITAAEVAQAVVMAVTKGYRTGQVIDVDGGHTIRQHAAA